MGIHEDARTGDARVADRVAPTGETAGTLAGETAGTLAGDRPGTLLGRRRWRVQEPRRGAHHGRHRGRRRGPLGDAPSRLEHQVLLELYYWERLPTAEIAEALALPPGTVRRRLVRARELVGARLLARGQAPDLAQSTLDGLERWAAEVRGRGQTSPA